MGVAMRKNFLILTTVAMTVLPCSCVVSPRHEADPKTTAAMMGSRPAKLQAVQWITGRLAARRSRFLQTGDLKEVFSVFYWHTTLSILERMRNETSENAGLILEMIEDFYGDYECNRSPEHREPHWEPYYRLASEGGTPDFKRGRELVQRAIEAHIDHDLPRVLRRLLERHPDLRGRGLESLKEALDSLNGLFLPCSAAGFHDLAKVLPGAPGPRGIMAQSYFAREIIRHKRRRAWSGAIKALRH
jgi:hypothetical protein